MRGTPRIQYERTSHVVPQSTSMDVWLEACRKAFPNKNTVGFSYDDAGIGDLDSRKALLYHIPPNDQGGYLAWFSEHYPGVEVVFRELLPIQDEFILTHWPATLHTVTQVFDAEKKHWGIDIAARKKDPIFAAADGTIQVVGWDDTGYGLHIRIAHEDGYETRYAHLNNFVPASMPVGMKVKGGQIIGAADDTGNSYGNHLHFEVRKKGYALDPWEFLKHLRE